MTPSSTSSSSSKCYADFSSFPSTSSSPYADFNAMRDALSSLSQTVAHVTSSTLSSSSSTSSAHSSYMVGSEKCSTSVAERVQKVNAYNEFLKQATDTQIEELSKRDTLFKELSDKERSYSFQNGRFCIKLGYHLKRSPQMAALGQSLTDKHIQIMDEVAKEQLQKLNETEKKKRPEAKNAFGRPLNELYVMYKPNSSSSSSSSSSSTSFSHAQKTSKASHLPSSAHSSSMVGLEKCSLTYAEREQKVKSYNNFLEMATKEQIETLSSEFFKDPTFLNNEKAYSFTNDDFNMVFKGHLKTGPHMVFIRQLTDIDIQAIDKIIGNQSKETSTQASPSS